MSGSTISTTINTGVTLGSGSYGSPLTITSTGGIYPPSAGGLIGIVSTLTGGYIYNAGTVAGSAGGGNSSHKVAQVAVSISGGTSLTNTGRIAGGNANLQNGSGAAGVVTTGVLRNMAAGTIAGGRGSETSGNGGAGVELGGSTLYNYGLVIGGNHSPILTAGGGYGGAGVSGSGLVLNTGVIEGGSGDNKGAGGDGGAGVVLQGTMINIGTIEGGNGIAGAGGNGVHLTGAADVLGNAGIIIGGYGNGYYSSIGGAGVLADEIVSIGNEGEILGTENTFSGFGTGIDLAAGGTVSDAGLVGGGYIEGKPGSFAAGADAIDFGSSASRLILQSGASFIGNVVADAAFDNVLELGGSVAGSIDIGTQFSGFSTIAFDAGVDWSLEGSESALSGGETITGFAQGDTITLDGFSATSYSYGGDELVLSDGSTTETLDIQGSFGPTGFIVGDTAKGTEIVICYLRGTNLLTPAGQVPVEDLKIGDVLVTRWQGSQPIKWIGRQSFGKQFVQHNRDITPVRIAAGALADRLPLRDLFVSPGHALLLDHTLVLAKNLVNGVTITQDDTPEEIHYYLIEFETHDCVIAEGTWAESFCDCPGLRDKFHNAASFYELYPGYRTPEEARLCAPRADAGARLDTALRLSTARAAASTTPGRLRGWVEHIVAPWKIFGWVQDEANLELPVLLELLLDGEILGTILACDYREDLAQAGIGQGRCSFVFTAPVNLTPDMMSRITVRRAADGAVLAKNEAIASPPAGNVERLRSA